ncbi:MAG: BMP family ABC transporter substrate-binding protein [Clostridia bacterium]|nr:BMP family ABC transporter substrate-binding protein [Clostridia bacterium]
MKKILSLLLVVVMCLGVVSMAACDAVVQKTDEPETTELSATAEPETTEPELPATEPETTEPEPSTTEPEIPTMDVDIPSDIKVGLICLHDENDPYDSSFIRTLLLTKAMLGLLDEQVMIRTGVGENSDCYTTAVELADAGCDIVFADSFGHEPYMIAAAKARPNTQFCHVSGTRAHTEGVANYHNAYPAIYEGRYLTGVVAGYKLNQMIADGEITAEQAVVGYVGAFAYAEVLSGLTAFYLGIRSVCPSATMKVRFTGSWYDPSSEQQVARALIENDHCVLLSQHTECLTVPAVCESLGVPNVAYNVNTVAVCPDTFLVASVANWAAYYLYCILSVVEGEEIVTDWCGGIADGAVMITDLNESLLPAGTAEAVAAVGARLIDGSLHVFDTSAFTVNGSAVTTYLADVDDDGTFTSETEVISDGCFHESVYRSAPYFDLDIDGIEYLNRAY